MNKILPSRHGINSEKKLLFTVTICCLIHAFFYLFKGMSLMQNTTLENFGGILTIFEILEIFFRSILVILYSFFNILIILNKFILIILKFSSGILVILGAF